MHCTIHIIQTHPNLPDKDMLITEPDYGRIKIFPFYERRFIMPFIDSKISVKR